MRAFYRLHTSLLFGAMLIAMLFIVAPALADTYNKTVTVNVTIPILNGGGNGGGGGQQQPQQQPDPQPEPEPQPLTITNVTYSTTQKTAQISWNVTGGQAPINTTFEYGLTNNYGQMGMVAGSYEVALTNLAPETTYFFKITAKDNKQQTITQTASFQTKEEAPIKPTITNVRITPGVTQTTIEWQTAVPADSVVDYGRTSNYGNTITEDVGNKTEQHAATIKNILPNTLYHFRLTANSEDGANDSTKDAVFRTLKDNVPPPDVSNITLTASEKNLTLRWTNPNLMLVPDWAGVAVVRKVGGPSANVSDGTTIYTGTGTTVTDSNVNQKIVYFYTIFSFDTSENYSAATFKSGELLPSKAQAEICDNGQDDNSDGTIDCADPQCSNFAKCVPNQEPAEPPPQPKPSVPGGMRKSLADLLFTTGNQGIILNTQQGKVTTLVGTPLQVSILESVLPQKPEKIVLVIGQGEEHQFSYQMNTEKYAANFSAPGAGEHRGYVTIDYGQGQIDSIGVELHSLSLGSVTDGDVPLAGVTVILYQDNQPVDMGRFGQSNPIITNTNGIYGWLVPNGKYYLIAKKDGYSERRTPTFAVNNNVINEPLELIFEPPNPLDAIDPDASLAENAAALAESLKAQAAAQARKLKQGLKDTNKRVNEFKSDPEVQKTTSQVVVPTTVTVTAAATVSLISWGDIIPLLRYLFLQPLMLLGARRRKGWGQVYNTLNKLPIDLATLRLVDAAPGKVLQTKVTDSKGRYAFVVNPGQYRIEAIKGSTIFPSQLLAGHTSDGRRADIYHGEVITVNENESVITANIPLDPAGENKKPIRLFWSQLWRSTQVVLSWFGLAVTAASLYIAPRWYVRALLGVHLSLLLVFRRLALPTKIKSWGIVYDAGTKQPVGRAVARLFSSQFNKLVSTQVTDGRGRYYFLAGDNNYYVTYDHPQYQPLKTDLINLNGKEAENIALDIDLQKQAASVAPSPPPSEPPVELPATKPPVTESVTAEPEKTPETPSLSAPTEAPDQTTSY